MGLCAGTMDQNTNMTLSTFYIFNTCYLLLLGIQILEKWLIKQGYGPKGAKSLIDRVFDECKEAPLPPAIIAMAFFLSLIISYILSPIGVFREIYRVGNVFFPKKAP